MRFCEANRAHLSETNSWSTSPYKIVQFTAYFVFTLGLTDGLTFRLIKKERLVIIVNCSLKQI